MRKRPLEPLIYPAGWLAGKRQWDYFKALCDEAKKVVETGKGAIPNERYRLYWIYAVPTYCLNIFDWLEVEKGAVVPMDMYNVLEKEEIDPDKPMEALARKGFL